MERERLVCAGESVPCNPKMRDLEECMRQAIEWDMNYVGVLIEVPKKEIECVIIPNSNFSNKLSYYQEAYNEELEHQKAEGVNIIGFASGDTFGEIERLLFGELEE